jgi:hypothetical protein
MSLKGRLACRTIFLKLTSRLIDKADFSTTRWSSTELYVRQDVPAVDYRS